MKMIEEIIVDNIDRELQSYIKGLYDIGHIRWDFKLRDYIYSELKFNDD